MYPEAYIIYLAHYFGSKFKAPSGTAATRPTNSDISASSVSNNNELGSFAKMMLDSTNVAFTCAFLSVSGNWWQPYLQLTP